MSEYRRYRIETEPAPNSARHPSRFRVEVRRPQLASLLLKELVHYRGNLPVVVSRPCLYGVFSGPIGGFAPREQLCVGCLRCTVQYPDIVTIRPNPERLQLGDSYVSPDQVDTILYEAATGRVPVRGAGYGGAYGGDGWDGMWTDMSEIVRPTRDGIHGREFISTTVDLGPRPAMLTLDENGQPMGDLPKTVSVPVPFLFDAPPALVRDPSYLRALVSAAEAIGTLVILPIAQVIQLQLEGSHIVPLVQKGETALLDQLAASPAVVSIGTADGTLVESVRDAQSEALLLLRAGYDEPILDYLERGFDFLHLTADYHGRAGDQFVRSAIRGVHERLVELGVREQVTLIGAGGIAAAEHVPKALISGLDAVALDLPLLLAVQGQFEGEAIERERAQVRLPRMEEAWATQRLVNLAASWRDQLLEILGAMGLREVRRLRGEVGRALDQHQLEREAFAGIEGYPYG